MAGLTLSDEDRARELAAYTRELQQTEARLAGAKDGSEERSELEQTADLIREQMRARGAEGVAPQKRAARRLAGTQDGVERR